MSELEGNLISRRVFTKGMAVSTIAALSLGSSGILLGCAKEKTAPSADPVADTMAPEAAGNTPLHAINADIVEDLTVATLGKDIKIACIIIANHVGLYEEENLNVTFETVANLSDAITAVSQDKLDVLPFGMIPTCTFVGQGVDNIVVFGGTIAEGSECVTLPENSENYKAIQDFTGKRIGYFPMETGHLVMQGLQKEAGTFNPNDWIITSNQQTIIEGVRKGELDCGFLNSGQGYMGMQSGLEVAMHVGSLKSDFPCCRQTTSKKSFDEKSSALVKFMIANLRAYDIYLNDRDLAIEALVAHSGQSIEYVTNVIYGTDEYQTPMIVSMDPYTDAVCDFYEIMKQTENIDPSTPYKMEDHVDSTIYKAALDELGERNENPDLHKQLVATYEAKNMLGK